MKLHQAVKGGSCERVEKVLTETGVDINAVDEEGSTPLHLAAVEASFKLKKSNNNPLKSIQG